jgi:hypothetical protein
MFGTGLAYSPGGGGAASDLKCIMRNEHHQHENVGTI